MDPLFAQILTGLLGSGGLTAVAIQTIALRRDRRASPLSETAARLDIVKQLDAERVARHAAETERDEANLSVARAGRERDAADRRAEAADRRANTERRAAELWESHATEVREYCLNHGTPRSELPPRPDRPR